MPEHEHFCAMLCGTLRNCWEHQGLLERCFRALSDRTSSEVNMVPEGLLSSLLGTDCRSQSHPQLVCPSLSQSCFLLFLAEASGVVSLPFSTRHEPHTLPCSCTD